MSKTEELPFMSQPKIRSSEITPEAIYHDRRAFLQRAGLSAAGAMAVSLLPGTGHASVPETAIRLQTVAGPHSTDEAPNSWEDITTYNNFYEFGTGKEDPHENAQDFKPRPWTVKVGGECDKPGDYQYEDLVSPHTLQDRVYRHRCVEAWSMVVPWTGIPMADLLKRFSPNSKAKFVRFKTLYDPQRMPGQRRQVLRWPYVEGLRMDEAMHPLTMMVMGVYGRELPNQNGAPMRLVVPWKYGFKGIKSIVEIEFTERQPRGSWEVSIPSEYGFYANVNPGVSHPRWSQARERRIGGSLFAPKQDTLMFNGYADQVASLYSDLDLRRNY
jgi:sulfoxide reductase catalytic subunit YedY